MRGHKILKRLAGLIAVCMLAAGITGVSALARASEAGKSPRSGALHVTKECSQYSGLAGQYCTITSSNINAIKVGSHVFYASAAGDPTPGQLHSDLIIDGPGNNTAYGHVVLDLTTFTGVVTFSGGTGRFRRFQARVDVSPLGWPNFAWDGRYRFGRSDDDD